MARQITRLDVVADGDKWSLREQGIGRLSSYATKQEATAAARAIAAQHQPCEINIRNSDGSTDSELS